MESVKYIGGMQLSKSIEKVLLWLVAVVIMGVFIMSFFHKGYIHAVNGVYGDDYEYSQQANQP